MTWHRGQICSEKGGFFFCRMASVRNFLSIWGLLYMSMYIYTHNIDTILYIMYIYINHYKSLFQVWQHVSTQNKVPTKRRIEQWRVGCSVGLGDDAVVLSRCPSGGKMGVNGRKRISNTHSFWVKKKSLSGWWFEPFWKILVNWDDYSQYMGK